MSEYNVYYHDINGDKINTFNVLKENGYVMDCIRGYEKNMSREEFDKELNTDCKYMYWCRCEYEVVISTWVGGDAEKLTDIYQQLKMNWDIFSEICWRLYNNE